MFVVTVPRLAVVETSLDDVDDLNNDDLHGLVVVHVDTSSNTFETGMVLDMQLH